MTKTQNRKFHDESLDHISWYKVVKNKFPCGRETVCCGQTVSPKEIVVTFPVIDWRGELTTTLVVHKRCLVAFLASVPDDIDVVRERVDKIVARFVKD